MSRSYETFEHPADLGLAARADTQAELFEALGECLADQVCDRATVRPASTRHVRARSDDLESLVVEFLSELMSLFHLEKFLIRDVRVTEVRDTSVWADVTGETFNPHRHELGPEIKAVTYHHLSVQRAGEQWTAQVLCDV